MGNSEIWAGRQRRVEPTDGLDDFPTQPWATRALIEHVIAPSPDALEALRLQTVWEPACGRGHMAAPLSEYFGAVHASDVADYSEVQVGGGSYRGQTRVADFLGARSQSRKLAVSGCDWNITNPPFSRASEFILRALSQGPRRGVAIFCRLAFLEGVKRHAEIYDLYPPSVVAAFVERVPLVKGRLTRSGSSLTAYCWLVWRADPSKRLGSTQLVWIPKCRRALERPEDYALEGEA
jgi:hypothetical protein